MHIPASLKGASKVIGWFSYTEAGECCCDGDACVIAGTEEKMRQYLSRMEKSIYRDVIKKTRFDEIINGIKHGAAYAFDEESYSRFYDLALSNGITSLPAKNTFLEHSNPATHFVRVQII